jgi:uncharacterized LabA/DUF88 family protein
MSLSQPSVYFFVDGGFLRKDYEDAVTPWFGGPGEIDYNALKRNIAGAHKMFYYDCLDEDQKPGESSEVFEARIASQKERLNQIKRLPGTHVTLGSLTRSKPRRQKRVDTLLALDMIRHAIRRNMDRAVLLSGDLDFEPVVKFLVDEGLYVEVAASRKGTAVELADAADDYRPLSLWNYHTCSSPALQVQYPVPRRTNGTYVAPEGSVELAQGTVGGEACRLIKSGSTFAVVLPSYKGTESIYVEFEDLDRLKLYCTLVFGELTGL